MSDWSSDVCSSDRQTQGALEQYAINLNERAADGRIDPLIGGDLEVERVMQTLCRRRKNNPLLVGEAGVGKTAIAEGLAWLVVEGKVPDLLKNADDYRLELGRLIAGTQYRDEFEKSFKAVITELQKRRGQMVSTDDNYNHIG